jgi:glyoxylase-like metal-dependent hydrolase (beta-lactamase superfamily II)
MTQFTEVADRVWVARLDWHDVNVTVVGGDDGLAVVDTWASTALARSLVDDVTALGGPVRWVVNTHDHFDHTFGNAAFVGDDTTVVAHEEVLRTLPGHAASVKEQAARDLAAGTGDPRLTGLIDSEIVLPHQTFSSVRVLDLGNRALELIHPGRGHTSGDLVVRIPDVDVVLAGDLVEEAGDGIPSFGDDSWPLEWPPSLDVVIQLLTTSSVVVPGHGACVDRDFVEEQRNQIAIVTETIRDLAARGVPAGQALEVGEWPWPTERLEAAVRVAYEQLPRSEKRLPLA